jgi:transposase-like protein
LTLRVSNQQGDPLSDLQLPREVRRRLAIIRHVEEVTGNVALTCRYYGISRQCYYSWYRRYQAHGLEGLRDRSKRPLVSPRATHVEVVAKIIYLRQHYHFGPAKIAMYLKALPPGADQQLRRMAHPEAAGAEPAAGLPAPQAPRPALEAL